MRLMLRWLALAISVAGPIVATVFSQWEGTDRFWPISWLAWGPVGFLILQRRPRNGVGASLLFIGAMMGVSFVTLGLIGHLPWPEADVWLEFVNLTTGVLPWLGIVWLVLVYPSGTRAGRGEVWLSRLLVAFGILGVLAFAFDTTPMDETGLSSPLALPAVAPVALLITGDGGFLGVPALLLGALVLMIRRWRLSAGLDRAQFRWLFFGASVFLVTLVVGQFTPEDSVALLVWLPSGFAIPVCIGVAVMRYRLYEIDRIISRTVAYAIVVGLLAGAIAILATVVSTQFESPLVVAATTLGVAAAFNPLRRRVQAWVDRRFNRAKYDAERVMDEFAATLRDQTDDGRVLDGWVGVVSDTMHPSSVSVWVRK